MGTNPVKLSVVIRIRNEGENLKKIFKALYAQRCRFRWEVIVVDNASEDQTYEICRQAGARVIPISKEEFTYGRALNRGIAEARGEIILTLSAHALPVGSYFFERVVEYFEDPSIAAVRCLSVYDYAQIKSWYEPVVIQYSSPQEQIETEKGRAWTRNYPAATCMALRKSVWQEIPFDEEIESVEDKLWAKNVLSRGWKVVRSADVVYYVEPFHDKRLWRRRRQREFIALYRISGHVPLRWTDFIYRTLRVLLRTPVVMLHFVTNEILDNWMLVTVPYEAKKGRRRTGSFPEFEKPMRHL